MATCIARTTRKLEGSHSRNQPDARRCGRFSWCPGQGDFVGHGWVSKRISTGDSVSITARVQPISG